MYGLVNKAVRGLLVDRYGEQTWQTIRTKAGIEDETFVRMSQYPDAVTYDLVAAASEHLQRPAEEILEAFGEYWTRYSAREGYGELLDMCGSCLVEFLDGLDDMHTRLGLSFPQLTPPSFRCQPLSDERLELHYFSDRAGLAPFVVGLIKGLGQRFDTEVRVEVTRVRDDGADFIVHHRPRAEGGA